MGTRSGNPQALIFCYSFDLYQSFFTSKVRIMPASTQLCNNDAEEFYLENNALQSRRGSIKVYVTKVFKYPVHRPSNIQQNLGTLKNYWLS